MTGLEITYPVLAKAFEGVPEERFAEWLSINTRKVLGLEPVSIDEGSKANFTLIDPMKEWKYDKANRKSKSVNSPFLNEPQRGRVEGIFNNGKWMINE